MFENVLVSGPGLQAASIIVGILALLLGRRLFWLVVAAVGFVIGLALAMQLLGGQQPDWVVLVIALAGGVIGAVVAILVQHIAVAIAGFLMGGYAVTWLLNLFNLDLGQMLVLIIFVAGGVIGALLAMSLFDLALVVISSLAGATLIVQAINLSPPVQALLFVVLVIAGIVVQSRLTRSNQAETASE